ncbi:hypothetical protein [Streptomyces dysideae]|uniref:Uncharacterized protein n=1 Tax=Streptomyces dysideae TaxID=909626 RepID=A0A117S156_9ACTN|nr:hypothetical protein [Streptomyces dysideae]KUO20675.1 hypothetical protein AQJ91_12140 [Streptomyces dysideae]
MPSYDAPEAVRPRMTIRVYRVFAGDSSVTEELGTMSVMADDRLPPLMSGQFPPCRCPLHREGTDQSSQRRR